MRNVTSQTFGIGLLLRLSPESSVERFFEKGRTEVIIAIVFMSEIGVYSWSDFVSIH